MENILKQIEELRERLIDTWRLLDIDRQKEEINELKYEMNKSDFWSDQARAIQIGKKCEELESEVIKWESLRKEIRDLEEFIAVAIKEGDITMHDEMQKKYDELRAKYEELEFLVLFCSKYDKNNAIISIHAGTGGTDAQDWAEILERMYLRFAEKRGWRAEILDKVYGNEAGIKNVSIKITGRWAYGYLKSESGVHRLVRISPFDAEAMRHTSFALAEVIPELPEAEEVEVRDEDLRVDLYRSSGPGGQNVNKTETAVRITHKSTGIVVACQSERSQLANKENCLRILKSKLFKLEEEKKESEEKKLKGGVQKAEWGKQIRSYVMQPYQLVKDHRTDYETADINSVLDGKLENFMEAYLREQIKS